MTRTLLKVGASAVLVLATMPRAANPTTLVQTQLVGVKGATVLSFVSQYLTPEVKALEAGLKHTAEEMLRSSGLKSTGDQDQYLTIDISGHAVSSELCTEAYMLHIVVAFSEPVRLARAPDRRLPNNNTVITWSEVYDQVVARSDLERIVTSQVRDSIELFIGNVRSVNRGEESNK
jgi:hypothetical protein